MTQVIPLKAVPKDVSDTISKAVYNPLTQDFTHKFDGEEQTIPAKSYIVVPENVAVHLALHLARVIVRSVAKEDRAKLLATVSEEKRVALDMKPYPLYNYRAGDVAKLLVTDPVRPELPKKDEILEAADENHARANHAGVQENKGDSVIADPVLADDDIVGEESDLSDMTVAELKEHAKENEIDLGEATKKADIIAVLRK